ncbi:hypothetical protein ABWL39_16600 [Chitinivorax sp. PXF-14]|uniref:hypothetical protein n=1 Tax=Chitinivorax sp. PXF-14 TaxID=3230488 RepID=UPI0034678F18
MCASKVLGLIMASDNFVKHFRRTLNIFLKDIGFKRLRSERWINHLSDDLEIHLDVHLTTFGVTKGFYLEICFGYRYSKVEELRSQLQETIISREMAAVNVDIHKILAFSPGGCWNISCEADVNPMALSIVSVVKCFADSTKDFQATTSLWQKIKNMNMESYEIHEKVHRNGEGGADCVFYMQGPTLIPILAYLNDDDFYICKELTSFLSRMEPKSNLAFHELAYIRFVRNFLKLPR